MDVFGGFFGNDSAFGRLMTKCGTFFAINILFVITCVPFVTVGAAFTAMYHTVFEMMDSDTPINPFRVYWQGLRENFLRATAAWLAFVGVLLLALSSLSICVSAGGWLRFLSAGVIAVMIAATVVIVYLMPGLALFSGKPGEMLKLSVCAAMSKPLKTLLVLLVQVGPLVLLYLDDVNRPTYAFVGTFFAFALIARIAGGLLLDQFEPYFPDDAADE